MSEYLDRNGLSRLWSKAKNAFAPTSHTHTKSNITDFPTSMPASDVYSWAKQPKKPTYKTTELIEAYFTNSNDGLSPTIRPLIDTARSNRLIFLPADQIIVEETTDGGVTWIAGNTDDTAKRNVFSETRSSNIKIPLIDGVRNTQCGLRVTFTAMKYNVPEGTTETEKYNYWNSNYVISTNRYCRLSDMYFWVSANEDGISVKIECARGNTPNSWNTVFENSSFVMNGWSGEDYVRIPANYQFGGDIWQISNYWNYRITFFTVPSPGQTELSTSEYNKYPQYIKEIRGYGNQYWNKDQNMMAADHLYSWDADKNAIFPAIVKGTNITSKGSATQPVYFDSNGVAQNTTYTLAKSVPSDAKFTDTTYSDATTSEHGLMTASDKTKLNGIAAGATAVTESTVSGWGFIKNAGDGFTSNSVVFDTNTITETRNNGTVTTTISGNTITEVSVIDGVTKTTTTVINDDGSITQTVT